MTDSSRISAVSEINVTPLVDVLLVLLIIFMVVVPLAPSALDTALPPRVSGSADPPALVVTVDRAGLALNRQPVATLEDLATRLADALASRTDRTVFVRAAGTVSYGGVVDVMDVATGAGASRIGIISGQ